MNDSFVYCWSDHSTSKVYVGVHKGTPDDGYICSSKVMLPEYQKRPEDFTRQIIAVGTLNDCVEFECRLIKQLLKNKTSCYNRAAGKMIINDVHPMLGRSNSEGGKKAAATKNKKRNEDPHYDQKMKESLSKGRIGKQSPRKGVVLSNETKEKISQNNYWKGRVGINAGKKFSDESKEKMRQSALKRADMSDAHKANLSASITLWWANRKLGKN